MYAWEKETASAMAVNVWRAKQWMTEDACVTSACIVKQGDDYVWLMMLLLGELRIQYADNVSWSSGNERTSSGCDS